MTWLRLDDGFCDHPKVDPLTDGAFRLHVAAMGYCARHLTDGVVAVSILPKLYPRNVSKLAAELVAAGLWEHRDGVYLVHDFTQYNPTRAKVEAERAAAAERQQRAREKAAASRRESRRDNTVTSRVTDGVSHGPPDPTRPDPMLSEIEDLQPPPSLGAQPVDNRVTAAVLIAASRILPNLAPPRNPNIGQPQRLAALRRAIVRDRYQHLAELATAHPDWTPERLADEVTNPATEAARPAGPSGAGGCRWVIGDDGEAHERIPA